MRFSWRKCLWISEKIARRSKHYSRMTDFAGFIPAAARGMTLLDRAVFHQKVSVPQVQVAVGKLESVVQKLRKKMLKLEQRKPVFGDDVKTILLHPELVKSWEDVRELEELGIDKESLKFEEIEVKYENFKSDEIFRSVLPEDQENLSSFSRIGHIVHVNLKDHLLPFKRLIGEVFLDKIPTCRTVVNKLHTIDSEFRNFQMELLAGVEDYQVEVRENGCVFEMDFSRVYWNPRLASEHERIVKSLNPGDFFCDIFAGVGPFSVPAGRRKCPTVANDLNPDSVKWLQHNVKRNKAEKFVKSSNKDGRQFIREDVKDFLLDFWKHAETGRDFIIAMNLPALAIEFLDAFDGLLQDTSIEIPGNTKFPLVHVYTFVKDAPPDSVKVTAEAHLSHKIPAIEGISFVRNVAPNKDMFRLSFRLTRDILFSRKRPADSLVQEIPSKKQCTSEGEKK
ncbi:tRNA (guanine(37)-N1)-methyltransferase [Sergentomyia squamirostris]